MDIDQLLRVVWPCDQIASWGVVMRQGFGVPEFPEAIQDLHSRNFPIALRTIEYRHEVPMGIVAGGHVEFLI
jgi:hypothetical protein